MNIEGYLKIRQQKASCERKFREICFECFQPTFNCYCSHIQKFDSKLKFIILIHPIEVKRRIATGRMSHLCLENSDLIAGHDYSRNKRVNDILENSSYHSMLLYPSASSMNLTPLSFESRAEVFPKDKTPVVFVVDGTWNTAKKMMSLSENLKKIPKICFTPPSLSNFRVRKQPAKECYSTIEAIHHTIELLGTSVGFDTTSRRHDHLIDIFDKMVEKQIEYLKKSNPRFTRDFKKKMEAQCLL